MSSSPRRRRSSIILTLGLSMWGGQIASSSQAQDDLKTSIAATVDEQREAQVLHGAVIVIDRGETVYESCNGIADSNGEAAITLDSRFQIASLTKLFTQIATLRLVEQGRIDLDANIAKYLPDFDADAAEKITVRHLFVMQSGLPREVPGRTDNHGVEFDEAGMAGPFLCGLDVSLAYEPGTNRNYSNVAYWVLGGIIEKVTEKPFADAVRELVLEPAGMTRSGLGAASLRTNEGFTRGHKRSGDGTLQMIDLGALDHRYASGGLYSTANDLRSLAAALCSGDLFNEETMELYKKLRAAGSSMPDGPPLYAGMVPGYLNIITFDPDSGSCVILLNNVLPEEMRALITVAQSLLERVQASS